MISRVTAAITLLTGLCSSPAAAQAGKRAPGDSASIPQLDTDRGNAGPLGDKEGWEPGRGFGLGFGIDGATGLASAGTYGWGGAYGSMYSVDPKEHVIVVFMMNQLPNHADVNAKFQTLVYQALVEPTM